jgi:hypothetical protein
MVPSLSPSPLLKPSSICCEFICLLHMLSVHIIQYVPPNIKTQTYNCLNKPKALHSKLTAPSPNPASPCFLSSSCPSPGNISKSNKLGPQIWIPKNSQTINQSLTSSSFLLPFPHPWLGSYAKQTNWVHKKTKKKPNIDLQDTYVCGLLSSSPRAIGKPLFI